jgi:hypothetical protein
MCFKNLLTSLGSSCGTKHALAAADVLYLTTAMMMKLLMANILYEDKPIQVHGQVCAV